MNRVPGIDRVHFNPSFSTLFDVPNDRVHGHTTNFFHQLFGEKLVVDGLC